MKIAIIGAGAAGCFAAANMPFQLEDEIMIFEKTGKSLQKVKVSGGGRCNVTHACFEVPQLLEKYPRGKQLLKKTLYQFGPQQTINWFEERGVQIKKEEDGRMFPITDSSQTIIDCLMKELDKKKIFIRYNHGVEKVEKADGGFHIYFSNGQQYVADKILIASGGYPKKEQYQWLFDLGHSIEEPVPSLFTFNMPKHPIIELMGVVIPEVTVKITGTKISSSGPLLITHWGMSGPAILKLSAWAARELAEKNYQFTILVNWLNGMPETDLKEHIARIRRSVGKQAVIHKNPFNLPKRFWEFQLWKNEIGEEIKWGDLPAVKQNRLMETLINDRYEVNGKTTFKEEFVTSGGIKLSEVNPTTMESRIVPGIYFAGEILDVDGVTGGFNFQHAWASGFIAAHSMARG
jgi:predicted Rossmann fold flavoprotein